MSARPIWREFAASDCVVEMRPFWTAIHKRKTHSIKSRIPTRLGTEGEEWRCVDVCVDGRSGTGDFSLPFIPCSEQLSSSIRETVRYKLQPCFRLTAHNFIIIFSDTKAALFFILARGLRFCLSPKDVDKYDFKCSFEIASS